MAATFVKVHLAPKTESSAFYYVIKPANYVKHLEIKLKLK